MSNLTSFSCVSLSKSERDLVSELLRVIETQGIITLINHIGGSSHLCIHRDIVWTVLACSIWERSHLSDEHADWFIPYIEGWILDVIQPKQLILPI